MGLRYGDVRFVTGGKTYTVRYGNLAWDELRRRLGATSEIGCLLKARESPQTLLDFFQVGLEAYHPGLSLDAVRQLYDEIPAPGEKGLNAAAWEAVTLALPELRAIAEGSGPKAKAPPAPPTRKSSSAKP